MPVPGISDPILIYQMGRVGSRTVFESLRSLLQLPKTIYHFHLLNGLNEIEQTLMASPKVSQPALIHIRAAKAVREKFLNNDSSRWNVITLVRDPVARNLSAFFYNITDYIPDFFVRLQENQINTSESLEIFVERYVHANPLNWFDEQFRDFFHFDVFERDFPVDAGYQIHHTDRIDLLLIRAEDLNTRLKPAMNAFLGIPNLEPTPVNEGAQKPYGQFYREFLAKVVLPSDYLTWMYDSRLAKHFYGQDEIERFRGFWSRK